MNIATPWLQKPKSQIKRPEQPVHYFVHTHNQPLRNAAGLLGGANAISLVDEIVERLNTEAQPSRQTLRLLYILEDLLFLRDVDNPNRIEASLFALIAPYDPIVEEICLLADDLKAALHLTANAVYLDTEDVQGSSRPSYSSSMPAIGGAQ